MTRAKIAKIRTSWEMFETAEPDISTERLIAQVATHCEVDAADVCDAIAKKNHIREQEARDNRAAHSFIKLANRQ